jgi:predicted phosphodiesterase
MKIQIKSDLHLENEIGKTVVWDPNAKGPLYVSPHADAVILAGDIINIDKYQIDYLKSQMKDVTVPIYYVPGNHEYWHTGIAEGRQILREELEDSNITLLDNDWRLITDPKESSKRILIVGSTLWTYLNPLQKVIARNTPDFKLIKDMNPELWNNLNIMSQSSIRQTLSFKDFEKVKKIVVTHHLPSYSSVPLRFKGNESNCIFVNNCEDLMKEEWGPDLWIHGHTHDSCDYKVGKTRVVCNPRGRSGGDRNQVYNNELLIEI